MEAHSAQISDSSFICPLFPLLLLLDAVVLVSPPVLDLALLVTVLGPPAASALQQLSLRGLTIPTNLLSHFGRAIKLNPER